MTQELLVSVANYIADLFIPTVRSRSLLLLVLKLISGPIGPITNW
jgi:hypothetical protein